MRTGKIGLRHFLHKRKVLEYLNSRCQCRQGDQTVKHILTACRKYGLSPGYWIKERRKSQYGELRMTDILINSVSLKKAAIAMKETGLIG